MYFLMKRSEMDSDRLVIGESFFFRPAPGKPLFSGMLSAVLHRKTAWRFVSIPRDDVPLPEDSISLLVEKEFLYIHEKSYRILPITIRRSVLYWLEAMLYLTVDESWKSPNVNRWKKTGGKGV